MLSSRERGSEKIEGRGRAEGNASHAQYAKDAKGIKKGDGFFSLFFALPPSADEDVCLVDDCSCRHWAILCDLRTNPNSEVSSEQNARDAFIICVRKMELDYLENKCKLT